ncbi:hypothetical protein DC082_02925 [Ignatzschineria indica]|uniref:Uncharacterized protein n=2 Tax=Ignatzschineriaceae TaxID=3018589 RepID=A0A2U2AMY6_9GAMM|nr:hypothetical protein DC082_02925 [Ignatzschineria indica]
MKSLAMKMSSLVIRGSLNSHTLMIAGKSYTINYQEILQCSVYVSKQEEVMKNLLREIMSNDDGRYSTTNFIQVISIIVLTIGFLYAVITQNAIASEIALFLAGIAVATPASKGWITHRRGENNEHD